MLKGISIVECAKKIEAQQAMKADFVLPARAIDMVVQDDSKVALRMPAISPSPGMHIDDGRMTLPILKTAHDQISSRLQIPKDYYNRMLDNEPELLAHNVSTWFARSPKRHMVRTIGGDARALLSDAYQRIENEQIAMVALPILMSTPGLEIVSCEVTERRLYIQATSNLIKGEVRVGDIVQAGVAISNSEIGLGSFSVSQLAWRLWCLNGAKINDGSMKTRHVGRRIQEGEDLNAIFADDTKKADDRLVMLKFRDVVKNALDENRFLKTVEKMRGLTEIKIKGDPSKTVEVLSQRVGATEDERGSILRALIEGGDLSAWGVMNAVTHVAHDCKSYDRAVDFEEAGGALLDLSRGEWSKILDTADGV